MITPTNENKNTCPLCSKVYKHISSLSRHKKVCTGSIPKLGRKEDETVTLNIEQRLTNIEDTLKTILDILSKKPEKEVLPIIKDIPPVIKKIKKVKEQVKEQVKEEPKLSVLEQKTLLLNGSIELTPEMIDSAKKQLRKTKNNNIPVEDYINNLPAYPLILQTYEDTVKLILKKYKKDYAYVEDNNIQNNPYCFFKKEGRGWVKETRLCDLTTDIKDYLTKRYINIVKDLYKVVSPYSTDYNDIIIAENLDITQGLINIREGIEHKNLSKIVRNTIKKYNTRTDINIYVDTRTDLQTHFCLVEDDCNYNVYCDVFGDYRKNKDIINDELSVLA